MPKFSVHVALMGPDYRAVSFAPGDEVPEWADGQVGAHVLAPEPESEDASEFAPATPDGSESEPEDEESESEPEDEESPPPADTPDFTAPAPRRNSRTRK